MKKVVALVIMVVMLLTSVCVHAEEPVVDHSSEKEEFASTHTFENEEAYMDVILNGEFIKTETLYNVMAGDVIHIEAVSKNGTNPSMIGYYFVNADINTEIDDTFNSNSTNIILPEFPVGTRVRLYIEYVTDGNKGAEDNSNRTGWQGFDLLWTEVGVDNIVRSTALTAAIKLEHHGVYYVTGGDVIVVHGISPAAGIDLLGYYWADQDGNESDIIDYYNQDVIEIVVPDEEPGTIRYIFVDAVNGDNTGKEDDFNRSGWHGYKLIWY